MFVLMGWLQTSSEGSLSLSMRAYEKMQDDEVAELACHTQINIDWQYKQMPDLHKLNLFSYQRKLKLDCSFSRT